ncbi:hypothetical protein SARC_00607 [Sphaeroforma arctica JP610]|uniref:Uncharacterized protein n=1 Tax=Sphaeroforma arctica JP610 TaxID=667725 RepID=A0A0L0GEF7_9EUKA|nr:hypothetical protein SARC_00607 [Sphaeroforma arctica JP610]KNC87279.1 hypothetical protein SARC_00607 [Sphaeroforma arctica JP610]|eukprot:XP_014161181.1 hypothetical protein SARC_00607 [Sphaeroforma arctica JP610]
MSVEYADIAAMLAELPKAPTQVPVARAFTTTTTTTTPIARVPTITATIPTTPATWLPLSSITQSGTGYQIACSKEKVHRNHACRSLKNKMLAEVPITGTTDLCKVCSTE